MAATLLLLLLLPLLLLAPASGSILATELMHLVSPPGGPSPASVALGPGAGAAPGATALLAQRLSPPIGLRAFDAAAAPLWSLYPPGADASTLLQVAACAACSGAVDAVLLQYTEESAAGANCTLRGVSAAGGSVAWSVVLPECAAAPSGGGGGGGGSAQGAQHVALAPAGDLAAAQLLLGGACVLLALEAPTGRELWRAPCQGGGLGVAFSGSGQWLLSTSGAAAVVHAGATGAPRGGAGCPLDWRAPPALSPAGDYLVATAPGEVWVCAWSQAAGAYGAPARARLAAWGQQQWLPAATAVLQEGPGGRVLAGTLFAAAPRLAAGRMFALDLACAAASAGAAPCAVVDALLSSDAGNATAPGSGGGGQGSIVAAGGYWFAGLRAGDGGGTLPTEFLFAPAGTGAPYGTPVWFWDGMGSVAAVGARLVESTPDHDLVHVLAGGPLSSSGGGGGGGGGGHVYWHSIEISK
jgi:hypothetical protein